MSCGFGTEPSELGPATTPSASGVSVTTELSSLSKNGLFGVSRSGPTFLGAWGTDFDFGGGVHKRVGVLGALSNASEAESSSGSSRIGCGTLNRLTRGDDRRLDWGGDGKPVRFRLRSREGGDAEGDSSGDSERTRELVAVFLDLSSCFSLAALSARVLYGLVQNSSSAAFPLSSAAIMSTCSSLRFFDPTSTAPFVSALRLSISSSSDVLSLSRSSISDSLSAAREWVERDRFRLRVGGGVGRECIDAAE